MTRRRIQTQRTILTGASSGIGRALAGELVRRGCRVVATARRAERLESLQQELADAEGELLPVAGDIVDPDLRQRLLDCAVDAWGGVDVLINNAGIGAMGPFETSQPDRLRRIMEVNLLAAAELIRVSLPKLAAGNQPLIVNMGSVLGHFAVGLKSEYCASKFALRGFNDALRAELVSRGVDVLLVSPSTTDSEFFDNAVEDTTQTEWKKRGAMSPSEVARHTIRAMERGRAEVILSTGGRLLCLLDRLFPAVARRILRRAVTETEQ